MRCIIGNLSAGLQRKSGVTADSVGAQEAVWVTEKTVTGCLERLSGGITMMNYGAAIPENTHVFLCDYFAPAGSDGEYRLKLGKKLYRVTAFDDLMGLHQHMEIYLIETGETDDDGE